MKFKELLKLIPMYVYIDVVVIQRISLKEVARYGFFDDGYDEHLSEMLDSLLVACIVPSEKYKFRVHLLESDK